MVLRVDNFVMVNTKKSPMICNKFQNFVKKRYKTCISHAFLPLIVTKLSTLKNGLGFLAHPALVLWSLMLAQKWQKTTKSRRSQTT